MKARVRWIAGAALLLLGLALVLFHVTRPKTLTVGIFAGSNWDATDANCYIPIDAAIERFHARHPDVKVSYISGIPRDEYPEWLAENIVMGNEPDIYLIPEDDLATLAEMGALMPLQKIDSIDLSAFYPAALGAEQVGDALYALPYQCVPTMMFVNKSLLARYDIPLPADDWTWADFYDICDRLTRDTDGDGRLDTFGCMDYTWLHAAIANGVEPFAQDGKSCLFDNGRVQQAIEFYREINALNQSFLIDPSAFQRGDVAFCPLPFSMFRAEQPYTGPIWRHASFDCISMPAGPAGGNISELSTLLMGVSARSGHPELAIELLQLMTADTEVQALVCKLSIGLSGLRSVVLDYVADEKEAAELGGVLPAMERVDGVLSRAAVRPTFRKYASAMQTADRTIQGLLNDRGDIQNGLLLLQRELTEMLRD